VGVSGRSAQIWTPLVKACGASSESSGASHSENIAISTTNFTYEMNSHLAQGLAIGARERQVADEGRAVARVAMPDGVKDTAVAPDAAATLASPPTAAVLAPPAPSPPPSHALVEHVAHCLCSQHMPTSRPTAAAKSKEPCGTALVQRLLHQTLSSLKVP
jgi:hypothetical protein